MNPAKLLKIDLDRGRVTAREIPGPILQDYLGGRGLSYKLLYDHLDNGLRPLDPGAPLIFSAGLLAGSGVPVSGRLQISALSPATGLLGSSNAGGFFAPNLAANGITALVIIGQAREPTTLWIEKGRAELRSAAGLWGLDAWETCERLGQSKRVQAAVIGPAGERRIPLACIMMGPHSAAGRTGMGAVMGSKNLKAVIVAAEPKDRFASTKAAKEVIQGWLKRLRQAEQFPKISQEGQSGYIPWAHEMGILATRNFQEVSFPYATAFDSGRLLKQRTRRRGCARCPVNCKADIRVQGGPYDGLTGPRPEFETMASLGPRCGIREPEAVYYLNNLCGRLGLDTISAGACVAFAMDLYEKGIIDKEMTGGFPLEWGDTQAAETLLHQMTRFQEFGSLFSHGVDRAAQELGNGAERLAYTVKGLELSAYDPRTLVGTALGYAVAGRGGDFGSVFTTPEYRWTPEQAMSELGQAGAADRFSREGKPELVRRCLIANAVLDSLGLCKVPALGILSDFSLKWEAELVSALGLGRTGSQDLLKSGERMINLERKINLARGAGAAEDRLPDYFFYHPAPSGPARGRSVDIEAMLGEFYALMGWDEQGRPTPAKLSELGLES